MRPSPTTQSLGRHRSPWRRADCTGLDPSRSTHSVGWQGWPDAAPGRLGSAVRLKVWLGHLTSSHAQRRIGRAGMAATAAGPPCQPPTGAETTIRFGTEQLTVPEMIADPRSELWRSEPDTLKAVALSTELRGPRAKSTVAQRHRRSPRPATHRRETDREAWALRPAGSGADAKGADPCQMLRWWALVRAATR